MSSKLLSVLGLVGSPRRNGNTETLVRDVLRGAESCGARTDATFLPELSIKSCLGCEHCSTHGACIHDDELAGVIEKLAASDVRISGTPVYFFGPSAQFKAFLDRWVGIPRATYEGKSVAYVVPFGSTSREVAGSTLDILERSMRLRGLRNAGGVLAPGLMNADESEKDAPLMARAYACGQELVKQGVET